MFYSPKPFLAVDLLPRSDGAEQAPLVGPLSPTPFSMKPWFSSRTTFRRVAVLSRRPAIPYAGRHVSSALFQNRRAITSPAHYPSDHSPAAGSTSTVGFGPSHLTVANRLICLTFNELAHPLTSPGAFENRSSPSVSADRRFLYEIPIPSYSPPFFSPLTF